MSTLTRQFSDSLHRLAATPLPPEVTHQAKRCLLDYLGAAFVGSHALQARLHAVLDFGCPVSDGVNAIGLDRRTSIETAALANGMAAHATEMDDGARFGMIHPGSPVLSALLPVAQRHRVNGEKLILGIVTGYEAALRLAYAVQPSHYRMGFHPTATCGAVGAAAGIAAMLSFTAEETEAAIAAAAIAAGGSLKVVDDGSEMKPFNVGRAAVTGVVSAITAKAGFLPPPAALEGASGFLEMMCKSVVSDRLTQPCTEGYWITKIYVKPYAACRHAHPAIEACLRYRGMRKIRAQDIESIEIHTYGGLIGRHDHRQASDPASARMSLPVSSAIALVQGAAGVNEFEEEILAKQDVRDIALKVTVATDDDLDALLPSQRVAIVRFIDSAQNSKEIRIDTAKGEPENPLSDRELEHKFSDLARCGGKSEKQIRSTIDAVMSLPDSPETLFSIF